MEKQVNLTLNGVKNDNFLPEGRTTIVLKYGTTFHVPSRETELIAELQKMV